MIVLNLEPFFTEARQLVGTYKVDSCLFRGLICIFDELYKKREVFTRMQFFIDMDNSLEEET